MESHSTIVEPAHYTAKAVQAVLDEDTAAKLIKGLVTYSATSGTLTTDTAANIIAALPGATVGITFTFTVRNSADGGSVSLAGGTGVTIKGATSVSGGNNRTHMGTVTSSSAVTLYSLAESAK